MKCFKQMFGFGGSGLTAMLLALGIGTATPAKSQGAWWWYVCPAGAAVAGVIYYCLDDAATPSECTTAIVPCPTRTPYMSTCPQTTGPCAGGGTAVKPCVCRPSPLGQTDCGCGYTL